MQVLAAAKRLRSVAGGRQSPVGVPPHTAKPRSGDRVGKIEADLSPLRGYDTPRDLLSDA